MNGWTRKWEACRGCGSSTRRHDGKGYCKECSRRILAFNRKHPGEPIPETLFGSRRGCWSNKYDACVSCGQADSPHSALGLCSKCYDRKAYRAAHPLTEKPPKPISNRRWTKKYACCVSCGRKDRSHQGRGLCFTCYKAEVIRPKRIKEIAPEVVYQPTYWIPVLGLGRVVRVYEEYGEPVADVRMVESGRLLPGISLNGCEVVA